LSFLLFVAAMQVAPPVIDPILEPRREAREQAEAAPAPRASIDPARARLAACAQLSQSDPASAIAEGARWLVEDGGAEAEQCLGLGYAADGQWDQARGAFLRAAESLAADDVRRPALLGQAANAALAGGDAAAARTALDAVLAYPGLDAGERGEALLDRARALVALGDGPAAQADLTTAQTLLPNDPLVWLFSATLARRQGEVDAAGDFIDRALELDQNNPAALLEAGNIAIRLNAFDIAREAWTRAAASDPESAEGRAATRNLAQLAAIVSDEANIAVTLPETDNSGEDEDEDPPAN